MNLNNRNGFTLLELLISISLSVVIIVIVFASLRLGYKSQAKGIERGEVSQKMRVLGDRITWLIRGLYPLSLNLPDGEKNYFEGKSDRIGLVTTSVDTYGQGPEDIAGLKWISIFVDTKGLQVREKVFFLEDVFDDSGGKLFVLDPAVKKLGFEYFDLPEDEKQGSWVSEWDADDKGYLPAAVMVKLSFEHNRETYEMPDIIVRISVQKSDLF